VIAAARDWNLSLFGFLARKISRIGPPSVPLTAVDRTDSGRTVLSASLLERDGDEGDTNQGDQ
jgi:hypothetical protein